MLPSNAGRKNGPLLGAIFLSAAAHFAVIQLWPVVASGSPSLRPSLVLKVSLVDPTLPETQAEPGGAPFEPPRQMTEKKAFAFPGREPSGGGSGAHASSLPLVPKDEALALDVRYFPPRMLDRVPVAEQYAIPAAPDGENALTGEVRLEVFVEADGAVTHVDVISLGDLPPEYAAAARAVFYRTRFSPGMRAGVAVPVRLKVVVKFGVAGP